MRAEASEIRTERLTLRRWREADREPFARMNRDPAVMEFFPALLTQEESNQIIDRIELRMRECGFGLWAVEESGSKQFIGFMGLSVPNFELPFRPCVEIGWRLASESWGQGLATEGARAVVDHAFGVLALREIVSFTTAANLRSRRVMEKLGMSRDPREDFDHPLIPEGHRLRPHVLYRLRLEEWKH
jgi:ribosomal-protein-alanine N-acetyltransferase